MNYILLNVSIAALFSGILNQNAIATVKVSLLGSSLYPQNNGKG